MVSVRMTARPLALPAVMNARKNPMATATLTLYSSDHSSHTPPTSANGSDPLTQHLVGVTDDSDVDDGGVLGDEPLDLGRGDIHATADDEVLGPVEVVQELPTVAGDLEKVAGTQVALLVER